MVVVLMYLDIVVVYPNHSSMVESFVDHVAIGIDLFVVDVTYDEVIEDLKRH
jgi:hypothetical protein